jgi:DNA-binding NarL/FixJ family response regulator
MNVGIGAASSRCAVLVRRLGRRLRIALLEDEPHTRQALERKLAAEPGIAVVASCATLASARAALQGAQADVLIADLGLPDGSGLELIGELHARGSATQVVVLTVLDDERKVVAAIERGARGYLLKDESTIGLIDAIVEVLDGGAPISPAIARYLVRRMVHQTAAAAAVASAPEAHLTERERQVLELAAKGFAHAEVAELLGVSVATIASYVRRIYEKLLVGSRAAAIYEATRLGLIDPR